MDGVGVHAAGWESIYRVCVCQFGFHHHRAWFHPLELKLAICIVRSITRRLSRVWALLWWRRWGFFLFFFSRGRENFRYFMDRTSEVCKLQHPLLTIRLAVFITFTSLARIGKDLSLRPVQHDHHHHNTFDEDSLHSFLKHFFSHFSAFSVR